MIRLSTILTVLILLIFSSAYGQKNIAEYNASNGITYKIGDKIKLGRGSATNGDFLYLQMGGWGAAMSYNSNKGSDQFNIGKSYSGLAVEIKKIKTYKFKGEEKVIFTVAGGNITNYNLVIEDAIATCEVADCKKEETTTSSSESKLDKLKKLKELLDSGTLTQEEFDKEKQKVLDEQ